MTTGSRLEGKLFVLPARFKWRQALLASAAPQHSQGIHRYPHVTLQPKAAGVLPELGVLRSFSTFSSSFSQSSFVPPTPQTCAGTWQLTPVSQLDLSRGTIPLMLPLGSTTESSPWHERICCPKLRGTCSRGEVSVSLLATGGCCHPFQCRFNHPFTPDRKDNAPTCHGLTQDSKSPHSQSLTSPIGLGRDLER